MDAIYGVTMEMLAEISSKHGELNAQYGQQQGRLALQQYLAQRGLDENVHAHAHNGWMERFRADPTGRLEARFHMLLSQLSMKAHMGDVRDMSQDTAEGVTLDTYAQITVAISRAGADAEQVARQFGLADVNHWQRANAAWTAKMGADPSHKLSTQFGTLYQKYAGPSFQQETEAQMAAALAAANAAPRVRTPQKDLTAEECVQRMQSNDYGERWKYAGLYANMVDLGNVPDKAAGIALVAPILLEMIERHDDNSTSSAELGIRRLWDLGVRTSDVHGAVSRCYARAREKLVSLQAAFAPIQNQAVPERIPMQAKIQDYTSLVETMGQYLGENWTPPPQQPAFASAAPPGVAPSFVAANAGNATKRSGFPVWLVVAPVVLLGAGAFGYVRVRGAMSASQAEVTSASVPAATPTVTQLQTSPAVPATGAATPGKPPKKK
jgi:hypothetical protein